jgi:uncharacterized phiE125 gp8 family phage protein
MHRPYLITPPAELPVSLAEAKDACRVTHDEQDALILRHINAAASHLDGYRGILGRCIVTQTWGQLANAWDRFRLPFPDVTALSLSYQNTAGETVVVPTSDYRLVHWHPALTVDYGSAWTAPSLHSTGYAAITLTMTCGYGTAAEVPADIKDAILIHVQALYDGLPREKWKPVYDDFIGKHSVKRI